MFTSYQHGEDGEAESDILRRAKRQLHVTVATALDVNVKIKNKSRKFAHRDAIIYMGTGRPERARERVEWGKAAREGRTKRKRKRRRRRRRYVLIIM